MPNSSVPHEGLSWRQLRSLLPRPSDASAWFDPATGLVGLSATREDVEADLQPAAKAALLPGSSAIDLDHEWAHFTQAIGFAYVYRWSTAWSAMVHQMLAAVGSEIMSGQAHRVIQAAAAQPDTLARATKLLQELTATNSWGISTFDLMEADAARVAAAIRIKDEDFRSLWKFMADHIADRKYRRCYDIVRLFCGDHRAQQHFHAIAALSLSSSNPPLTFQRIVTRVSLMEDVTTSTIVECALDVSDSSSHLLTLPFGIRERFGHAFLDGHLDDVAAWITKGQATLLELLARPSLTSSLPALPTVAYGTRDDDKFEVTFGSNYRDIIPGTAEAEAAFAHELTVTAASEHLLQVCMVDLDQAPHDARGDKWLTRMPPQVPTYVVPHSAWVDSVRRGVDPSEQIAACADEFIGWMCADPNGGEPLAIPGNRIGIILGDDIDGEVWEDELSQRLMRQIADRNPTAALFLPRGQRGESLILWFGCLAPAAMRGLDLDLMHDDVRQEFDKLTTAIDSLRTSRGIDLTLALEAFLLPITQQIDAPY